MDTVSNLAKYYVELVPNEKKEVLLKIIQKICVSGAEIHTNIWKSYLNPSDNFIHKTGNHKFNFINPNAKVHSQHVESLWNKKKKGLTRLKHIYF